MFKTPSTSQGLGSWRLNSLLKFPRPGKFAPVEGHKLPRAWELSRFGLLIFLLVSEAVRSAGLFGLLGWFGLLGLLVCWAYWSAGLAYWSAGLIGLLGLLVCWGLLVQMCVNLWCLNVLFYRFCFLFCFCFALF